jgi:isopenicillin-N N-acyltransferase-like protein
MNAAGGAVSVMSLSAPDDGVGVPRVLVSRHALGARDPGDAVRRATLSPRSGGYAYLWGWPGGRSLGLETSATRHATVDCVGLANHCIDPALATSGDPPGEGSRRRYARACALVESSPPGTLIDAMAVLADHEAPICVHPDPAEGDEADCVVFAMAVDVERGELWVADGNPCEGRVERFGVRELLEAG